MINDAAKLKYESCLVFHLSQILTRPPLMFPIRDRDTAKGPKMKPQSVVVQVKIPRISFGGGNFQSEEGYARYIGF